MKKLRNTVFWGAGLVVYLLVVAGVFPQLFSLNQEQPFRAPFDPSHSQEIHSFLVELDGAAEYSGVLLPMGPGDRPLPGLPALWDKLLRVADVSANESDVAGFDGIQAVKSLSELSRGAVSELFFAGIPERMVSFGALFLLQNSDGNLHLIDCTHPRNPMLMEPFPYSQVEKILLQGTIAYLLKKNNSVSATEFVIVDLADPANPRELARHNLSGKINNFFLFGERLITYRNSGGYKGRQSFQQYDLTKDFDLVLTGRAQAPVLSRSAVIYANYLLTPDLRDGVNIYDFSNPLEVKLVSSIGFSGRVRRLARFGNQLFAHCEKGKMYVVDLQNIKDPALSAVINEANHFAYVMKRGGYSYYFAPNGYLRVFDTTYTDFARSNHAIVAQPYSGQFVSEQEKGGLLLSERGGEPLAKDFASIFSLNEGEAFVDSLFWKDLYVVLDKFGAVSFFQKNGSLELKLVQRLELSPLHQWLAAGGDQLYVGGTTIDIIGWDDGDLPAKENSLSLDAIETSDGLVVQNTLFVAAGESGLLSFRLNHPAQPEPLPIVDIPKHLLSQIDARQLVSPGADRVMVAGGAAGLIGLKLKDGVARIEGVLGYSLPVSALTWTNGFCLLSDGDVVHVVDVGSDGSLQKMGKISFAGVERFAVVNKNFWAGYVPGFGWRQLPSPRFISVNKASATTLLTEPEGLRTMRYRLNLFDDNGVASLPGWLSLAATHGQTGSGENYVED